MNERERHAIDASLRRQFAPPNLDALADRIAAAAAAIGEDATAAPVDPTPARPRVSLGLFAAVAAAAAIVLWLAPDRGPARDEIASVTAHQIAGRQLDAFLRSAAYREIPSPDALDCVAEGAGGDVPANAPILLPTPDLRIVWECGGSTGIDCAAHDLPARRMMVVQVTPAGPHVIVCIEPPGFDPAPELPATSDYNIFRRTLGGFTLYEISPLDTPRALDALTI